MLAYIRVIVVNSHLSPINALATWYMGVMPVPPAIMPAKVTQDLEIAHDIYLQPKDVVEQSWYMLVKEEILLKDQMRLNLQAPSWKKMVFIDRRHQGWWLQEAGLSCPLWEFCMCLLYESGCPIEKLQLKLKTFDTLTAQ